MTTTAEPTIALANREFTDKQIQTRIEAAKAPGFGLERATSGQLNMIYLLAKHYDVDPAVDITLYRDRPWFTIDGRVRLMKRHPQYRGYQCRPIPASEKEAWGYKSDDLVIECSIRTKDWGEIKARGKVSGSEMKQNAPTGTHPSEMAEKRAIARASRMAFGQDVPDEDDAGFIIEERNDPERNRVLAAKYDEVYGRDDDGSAFADQQPAAPVVVEPSAKPVEMVKSVQHRAYQELAGLVEAVAAAGIDVEPFKLAPPAPLAEYQAKIAAAQAAIEAAQSDSGDAPF